MAKVFVDICKIAKSCILLYNVLVEYRINYIGSCQLTPFDSQNDVMDSQDIIKTDRRRNSSVEQDRMGECCSDQLVLSRDLRKRTNWSFPRLEG